MSWISRPLNKIPSIKLKLSIVIIAGIGVTVVAITIGWELGAKARWSVLAAVLLALLMVQILARGMTSPLRAMARAAGAMAKGDYTQRVEADGADEVGQLGRSFNSLAEDLEDLERQRNELIANVSHELRTPLTAIHGQLENLVDGVSEPSDELFQAMLRQTDRLDRLVKDLLSISRIEAGALRLNRSPVGVAGLLAAAANEAELGAGGPHVHVDAPSNLRVHADEDRLRQVFANLIDNACRFSPAGAPVRVAARYSNGAVEVTVTDSGPGIPADERTRVFERFHRVDTDRSSQTGGTGLGLAIAKSIVDAHGGSIHAEAAEPNGCRMVVRLDGVSLEPATAPEPVTI